MIYKLSILFLFLNCFIYSHEETLVKLTDEQIKEIGFTFKDAKPGVLKLNLSARGKIALHPDRIAHIIPKISGIAKEANKNIGDTVKTNDLLAILESQDIAEIKANFLASLSKENLAKSLLTRELKLFEEKVTPEQDYLNAKNAFEEAFINVQLSKQKLKAFGLNDNEIEELQNKNNPDLKDYLIRSPINGTVLMRHITKGEFIDNREPIYEIADLDTVWVEIGIYPKDISLVKKGQTVTISVPNETLKKTATIYFVSPIVSEETIASKAIAEVDNKDHLLKPGVFVTVNIQIENIKVPLMIAKEAVLSEDGQHFVFVVTKDGFEKREITLGKSDNENVEIVSGLNKNETYVAKNAFLLKAELGKSNAEHMH